MEPHAMVDHGQGCRLFALAARLPDHKRTAGRAPIHGLKIIRSVRRHAFHSRGQIGMQPRDLFGGQSGRSRLHLDVGRAKQHGECLAMRRNHGSPPNASSGISTGISGTFVGNNSIGGNGGHGSGRLAK